MDTQFSEYFITRWKKYFGSVDLPVCYFYTDQVSEEDRKESNVENRCLIGLHASERLEQRGILEWQVIDAMDRAKYLSE